MKGEFKVIHKGLTLLAPVVLLFFHTRMFIHISI